MERTTHHLGQGRCLKLPRSSCALQLQFYIASLPRVLRLCCVLSLSSSGFLEPFAHVVFRMLQAVGIASPDDLTFFNALDFLAKAQLIQNRMGGSNRLGEA